LQLQVAVLLARKAAITTGEKRMLQFELNMSATAQDLWGWKAANWERSAVLHLSRGLRLFLLLNFALVN
jgi:hypothetical protein